MKLAMSALVLLVLVIDTFSEAIPRSYEENQFTEMRRCTSHYDCPSGSCCILTPDRYAHPHCAERPKAGDTCRPRPIKEADRVLDYLNGVKVYLKEAYMNVCPCSRGLACDSIQHVCRRPTDSNYDVVEQ